MPNALFPCAKCGSKNTILRSSMPSQNGWKKLLSDLWDSCPSPLPGANNGKKFVVCKDCGHTSVVMVN